MQFTSCLKTSNLQIMAIFMLYLQCRSEDIKYYTKFQIITGIYKLYIFWQKSPDQQKNVLQNVSEGPIKQCLKRK